jgi:hypothetical protein
MVDSKQKLESVLERLNSLINERMSVGETLQIETSSLGVLLSRKPADQHNTSIVLESGEFKMAPFCELIADNACSGRIVTLEATSVPMAGSGHNGDNETSTGFSSAIGLKFYNDKRERIEISSLRAPIDIWIKLESSLAQNGSFQFVNASNAIVSNSTHLLPNGFNVSSSNVSLFIQIKPVNPSLGYLIAVKLGATPYLNSTGGDYDFWRLLCPNSGNLKQSFIYIKKKKK